MRDFKRINHLDIILPTTYHRKMWEFCFIYNVLLKNNKLKKNSIGLGFGVGKEPLTSLFASLGCTIFATDLDGNEAERLGWSRSNQYSSSLDELNGYGLCNKKTFRENVTYENIDMNAIPAKYNNKFDFTWSSCSLEHCGNMDLAENFIINQMSCLKDDGIAVHTTEYNLSSNIDTITEGETVIFRRLDIEKIVKRLNKLGASIRINYSIDVNDKYAHSNTDYPPYTHNPHLKLKLGDWVSTSIGLIIKKHRSFFDIFLR